jgi:hypothetical protein
VKQKNKNAGTLERERLLKIEREIAIMKSL